MEATENSSVSTEEWESVWKTVGKYKSLKKILYFTLEFISQTNGFMNLIILLHFTVWGFQDLQSEQRPLFVDRTLKKKTNSEENVVRSWNTFFYFFGPAVFDCHW